MTKPAAGSPERIAWVSEPSGDSGKPVGDCVKLVGDTVRLVGDCGELVDGTVERVDDCEELVDVVRLVGGCVELDGGSLNLVDDLGRLTAYASCLSTFIFNCKQILNLPIEIDTLPVGACLLTFGQTRKPFKSNRTIRIALHYGDFERSPMLSTHVCGNSPGSMHAMQQTIFSLIRAMDC